MNRRRLVLLACLFLPMAAAAQNYTAVSASNITDLNGNKLRAGTICFTGTDQYDNAINFMVGGGGTILKRAFCFNVAAGAITTAIGGGSLQVPNPANTSPAGVNYRIQARDSLSNRLVIDYRKVVFTGGTFNLDSYAPTGTLSSITGSSVTGPFTVNGNLSVTGALSLNNVALPSSGILSWGSNRGFSSDSGGLGIIDVGNGITVGDTSGELVADKFVSGSISTGKLEFGDLDIVLGGTTSCVKWTATGTILGSQDTSICRDSAADTIDFGAGFLGDKTATLKAANLVLTGSCTGCGGVSSVTASAPLGSSGGTTPNITVANKQGTDSNLLTAGTVSGTGATLCTDANGGATTSSCGAVTSVTASAPLSSSGGTTPNITVANKQGTDSNLLTAGTVSGTGALLCTDANGGATTSSCTSAVIAHADATAQSANISSTLLYSVPSTGQGMYRASCYVVITQAATTSSQLPNCQVAWTDKDSSVAISAASFTFALTNNTVGATKLSPLH